MPSDAGVVQCLVRRDKSGFSKKFYPKYDLLLESNERFLLAGQKMQLMRSAYYSLSLERDRMGKDAPGFIGKLRSNFSGTEYSIFGPGRNPDTRPPPSELRSQHGAVLYVSKLST